MFWGVKGLQVRSGGRSISCLRVLKARRKQQKSQTAWGLGGGEDDMGELVWDGWIERHETEPLLKWQRAGTALQDQQGPPLHCT